jgi:hypothetical protein
MPYKKFSGVLLLSTLFLAGAANAGPTDRATTLLAANDHGQREQMCRHRCVDPSKQKRDRCVQACMRSG